MIGYLFLGISLLSGATKGYCGKRISGNISTVKDSTLANVCRMILCIVIGFLFVVIENDFSALVVHPTTIWISLLSGFCSVVFVISWLFAVKQSAYMMVEVFLLLGTLIPITLSYFLFNESVTLIQIAGIALLLVAVYIMSTYNVSIKGKMSFKSMIPLIIAGVSCGFSDFSQKLFSLSPVSDTASTFNLYTYVFAGIFLTAFYIVLNAKTSKTPSDTSTPKLLRRIWLYVLVMAICLFANSYFKTLSAYYIPSAQLYPLSQGLSVILSLLMAVFFFKEKINRKCIIGICLAFVALMMINLL